jgi:hypothetical protein
MKLQYLIACFATLMSITPVFAQTQSWEAPYSGADATGADVVALWHFDDGAPGKDASGHGHDLTLRGKDSQFVADGKFGGALEVDEKTEPGDTRQGATIRNTDDLNPKGAFTLEMWMSPSAQLAGKSYAVLLDKKYYNYASDKPAANTAYILGLRKSGDQFVLEAQLGFGKDSAIVRSLPQTFDAGQWYHVAFTYDGNGLCTFYLGATRIGQTQLKDRGPVTPGNYALVIGDRVGSTGWRFYGKIDEVRILDKAARYVSGKVLLDTAGGRTAFYRMEKNARVRVSVSNDTLQPLKNASVKISAAGVFNKTISIPTLAPDKSTFITVPLDTTLRPAGYQVTAVAQNAAKKLLGNTLNFPLTIVPRPLPHQMPIVMWASATNDYKQLTDIGYTGELVNMADYGRIWDNGNSGTSMPDDAVTAMRKKLDDMMAAQVGGLATLTPGRVAASLHPEFNRTDRNGKKVNNTDGLYPEIQKFSYNTGAAVARTFGDMPGWKGALIHTEVRDGSTPSFNDIDKKAYRNFSGQEIPPRILSARGISYTALPVFPSNRIVADDYPLLQYYKWFWKEGDAWPKLNSEVNNGLKSTGRNDIFTWFDPSVRAPSIWGSGGNVDFLNQWTYTYPDPLKVGLATDEQFAMAEGRPRQKVMNMIQIIWYRSQTTGTPVKGQETEWEKVSPDAKFISIAPDQLSEGTWLELSRPVQAIANHGWGSLGDHLGFSQGSYVTTNVDTRKRMTDLYQNVVKPLGPALLQVPDYKTDVAFLESFASQMFANTGTYGWGGGWGADSYMIARYAGLQPRIVYDETIQQKGLDQYKVLFLTDCPVLTQSVAGAIKKFQQRGGIVIGDENLAPGITPDILLPSVLRGAPDAAKALLLKKATELRNELDTFYRHPVDSSNPEIITRLRQFGNSQYVFTVNDHRTYGDYVGQYKKVMEKGLPAGAQITLNTMPSGAVYNLMNHHQVPTTRIMGKVQFPVSLNGGEGNVFLVTPKPVGKLQVSVRTSVKQGGNIPVKVLLADNAGKTLNAVIPLHIVIHDTQGRIAEKSGYYGAANGSLNLDLNIAPNDVKGKWHIDVTEALTGQTVTQHFEVK